jgi:hypothetical protein
MPQAADRAARYIRTSRISLGYLIGIRKAAIARFSATRRRPESPGKSAHVKARISHAVKADIVDGLARLAEGTVIKPLRYA